MGITKRYELACLLAVCFPPPPPRVGFIKWGGFNNTVLPWVFSMVIKPNPLRSGLDLLTDSVYKPEVQITREIAMSMPIGIRWTA